MEHKWTIRLFAGLNERLGASSIELLLPNRTLSVSELKALLSEQYASHRDLIHLCFVACNQAYAQDDAVIEHSDELALLPPVSGGEESAAEQDSSAASADAPLYWLTDQPISVEEVTRRVIIPNHGASIAFVGTTREWTQGQRTVKLEYEAYAPMAIRTMEQIGEEIAARWNGAGCAIAHRTGIVDIADISVVIAVSAPHRDACYEASRYAIERLKQIVPIWKKEIWDDGSEWKGHQTGPWNPLAGTEQA
ncbi:molybdopterin synthase catalytic subunit [Paenibacillus cellulosilyticus]|uniref:Molybdopterin synthase catalytic subunit n=1 Tax=Paenibacillus cellulosilyticus TaxID=375489 RepID=A0A2V2YTJ4_9BACL|nr:molybdenum cofactor biosynthesis protein MoaE [Paenibacillus cellulosilyticus]PWW01156.1 molybdopterin synthase catalytic subunit [Paenibacillus cellulosilyticus]QKS46882.1 molybdenum cofactor biosynthesis protein MoaE [Paenibacillus cellulosilyticus]